MGQVKWRPDVFWKHFTKMISMKDQMGVRIPGEAGFPSAVREPMFDPVATREAFEALQHAKQDLQRAHDYTRAVIEAVPPLLVLDADLRVKEANESFYKHFHLSLIHI